MNPERVKERAVLSENNMILYGFLSGMALDANLASILPCLKDVRSFVKDLDKIIGELQGDSLANKIQGFRDLEHAIKELAVALKTCSGDLKSDYLRIKSSLEALRSPKSFEYLPGEKLEINHVNVLPEVALLIKDFGAKRWQEVGFSIGAILAKICGTGTQ